MEPCEILSQVRKFIAEHAGADPDKWWYCNRFVFARLMLDERKTKAGVRKKLIESKAPCHYCGKAFDSTKGVHLHRVDEDRGYSPANCVLMHPDCHERCHAEKAAQEGTAPENEHPRGRTVVVKESKFYDDMPFSYWWDISPSMAERMDRYEAVEFVCKDSGARCSVPSSELKRLLTKDRQTSRGTGHWGVKVLSGREDELALEPGSGGEGQWLFLPVTWSEA